MVHMLLNISSFSQTTYSMEHIYKLQNVDCPNLDFASIERGDVLSLKTSGLITIQDV